MEENSPSGPGITFLPEEDLLLDAGASTIEEQVKVCRALSRELSRQVTSLLKKAMLLSISNSHFSGLVILWRRLTGMLYG